MDFIDAMSAYFAGEKTAGLLLIPIGLALAAFAAWVFRAESGGFMWGLGAPLAVVALGAIVAGAVLAARSGPQLADLIALYEADVTAFVIQEGARMARVNGNWAGLKLTWTIGLIVSVASLALVDRDWVQGAALALLMTCALAMVVDTFAERRAVVYTEHIEAVTAR